MSHYFETPDKPAALHEVQATIWDDEYTFWSAPGVFSAHRLDPGTRVLFRATQPPPASARRLLDLGCGFGPIAVALARNCPDARVDAVDVNALACELTARNAERFGVGDRVHSGHPGSIEPQASYDEIWSNPPIRVGKTALHDLLMTWLPRLRAGGIAWLVVGRNLGADSLQTWLIDQGWPTDRVASSKGYRVLRIQPE
ncbi:methyltransferase [Brooklawnia cerclae]|uniref:16S rRNA G1207 methylase RsmC n=1 Tax=Brooklawnia cerclae TaxID=349934 RepID=A0ABX0SC14_9ACTN|nr:methyltransferase [Brooklawnia cerclae]NIH55869.1 16S rRNA G1207 methylase RsmC [Brooklawnia cerclae]